MVINLAMFWTMDYLSYRNTSLVSTNNSPLCCGCGDSKILGDAGVDSLPLRPKTIDKNQPEKSFQLNLS